ncbi:unnamed protein product [[Candida] boidinii]|nr:unnamed protein product [[Candida] boidinii]GMG02648.1 unnamed protein product [[Candida] boidinii]
MSSILGSKLVRLATARAIKSQSENTFTKGFSSCSQRYTSQKKTEDPISGTTAEKKPEEETFNPHVSSYFVLNITHCIFPSSSMNE